MEFWGVEVKPGQNLTCDVEIGKVLHISQAALGESKIKGSENVPIFVNFNGQKLVLGTLSQDKFPQISYDLVFEKDFELSHGSKNSSVYFTGYRTVLDDDEFSGKEDCFDCHSEDIHIAANGNGKVKVKNEQGKPTLGKADDGKEDNLAAKTKVKKEEPVKSDKPMVSDEDDEDEDEDDEDFDEEDDSDDDEDMLEAMGDSDDEDASSEDEDEATPQKAAVIGQKRSAESASKTPAQGKKAKVISPAGKQKSGGDGKKGIHTATPHPAKQAGKTPANKLNPKSAGSVTCKSCSKFFNSENALQAHSKAKHSGSK